MLYYKKFVVVNKSAYTNELNTLKRTRQSPALSGCQPHFKQLIRKKYVVQHHPDL